MRTAKQFHEGKDPVFRQIAADLKDALHILRELHAIASVWIEQRLNDRPELKRGS